MHSSDRGRDNSGPNLALMTGAERAIVLTEDGRRLDERIASIPASERTSSKSAIKRAQTEVRRLRQHRAAMRLPAATTVSERLRLRLAISVDRELRQIVNTPAAGRTIAVEIGTPMVACEVNKSARRYPGRRRFKMSISHYTITLSPGRTSVLRAAGVSAGAFDGRLILSAQQFYVNDDLTILACMTAVRYGPYRLRMERCGDFEPRLSYLAVWRDGARTELQWHTSEAAALGSRPRDVGILRALLRTPLLTPDEDIALSQLME